MIRYNVLIIISSQPVAISNLKHDSGNIYAKKPHWNRIHHIYPYVDFHVYLLLKRAGV